MTLILSDTGQQQNSLNISLSTLVMMIDSIQTQSNGQPDRLNLPIGITLGLLASFIQSLGLTIQRKSHIQNESLPFHLKRPDYLRPVWIIGFVIYFSFNILGSIFQIGTLPLIILGPLGAISLLWNAILANFLLGDRFSYHLVIGTILISIGAVLIAIFGVVPEQDLNHDLDQLIRLYSRGPFLVEITILGLGLLLITGLAHYAQSRLDRSLDQKNFFKIHHSLESPPGTEHHQLYHQPQPIGRRASDQHPGQGSGPRPPVIRLSTPQPSNSSSTTAATPTPAPAPTQGNQNFPITSTSLNSPLRAHFSINNRERRRCQRSRRKNRSKSIIISPQQDSISFTNHPIDIIDSHIPLTPTLTRARNYSAFRLPTIRIYSLLSSFQFSDTVDLLRVRGSNNQLKRPSPQQVAQLKLMIGVAYGISSGTLSGICLLFAKTGVELLIRTVAGHQNQFDRIQTWLILLILLISALLQLWYLNKALKLVNPTMICPLAFCFYNLSSIVSSLVYYDQFKYLSSLQVILISAGTIVLLAGVWVVSLGTMMGGSDCGEEKDGRDSSERNGLSEESRPLLETEDCSDSEFGDEVEVSSSFDEEVNEFTGSISESSEGDKGCEEEEEEEEEEYCGSDDGYVVNASEARNHLRRSLTDDTRPRLRTSTNTIDQIIRQFLTEGDVSPVRGLSIGLGAASPGFAIRPSHRRSTCSFLVSDRRKNLTIENNRNFGNDSYKKNNRRSENSFDYERIRNNIQGFEGRGVDEGADSSNRNNDRNGSENNKADEDERRK
ncbi:hypothetical protein BY996DRAFT_6410326 [Phakopsora pachyrhizi]|nr:hypothetical protein BY996DRAFT_6410326 [Phakopsora pachyrhizi]